MLDDYKKRVLLNYKEKKESAQLSSNLTHPTPKKLKDECLIVLRSRTKKKDEAFIKMFFNSGTESDDYSRSIRKFEIDRLRPLVNFLNERIERTDPNNVELLAWLIDFERRPYDYRVDYTKDEVLTTAQKTTEKLYIPYLQSSYSDLNPKHRSLLTKKVIWTSAILSLMTTGTYLYSSHWNKAYICDRGTAKKYHLSAKCPALKNCKNNFISTTIDEAEKNGKSLCGWEE